MFEQYLILNGAGPLLKYQNDPNMPKTKRTQLFRHTSQYLRANYGNIPSRTAKEAMEKVIVEMFPWMNANENGNVSKSIVFNEYFVNKIFPFQRNPLLNNIDGGMIGIALKNSRRADRMRNRLSVPRTVIVETANEEDDAAAIESMNYLKALVVNDQNMDEIKQQLINTQAYRSKLMRDVDTDIKEEFPFFFADPKLVNTSHVFIEDPKYQTSHFQVLFDFIQRFPTARSDGLIEAWSKYNDSVRKILLD